MWVKEHEPGCLHADVTCFPKFALQKTWRSNKRTGHKKNPFPAVEKPVVSKAEPWFMLKPEIFKQNPREFSSRQMINILSYTFVGLICIEQ
jgi:hypothetical protein